jgi:hypothetical protein
LVEKRSVLERRIPKKGAQLLGREVAQGEEDGDGRAGRKVEGAQLLGREIGGGRGKPVVISPLGSEAAKDGGEDLREKDHVRGGRGNWLPEVEDGGDDDGKGYAQEKGKLLGTEAAWEEGEYLVDERNKRDNSLGLCSFKALIIPRGVLEFLE